MFSQQWLKFVNSYFSSVKKTAKIPIFDLQAFGPLANQNVAISKWLSFKGMHLTPIGMVSKIDNSGLHSNLKFKHCPIAMFENISKQYQKIRLNRLEQHIRCIDKLSNTQWIQFTHMRSTRTCKNLSDTCLWALIA